MFAIRVDGNEKIGMGHIMRCLSIAEALRTLGEETLFITADGKASDTIEAKGFLHHILDSRWDNMELELDKLIEYLENYRFNTLLVDSYQVTEKYMEILKNSCYLYYLDDIGEKAFTTNEVINYNIYASKFKYQELYQSKNKEVPKLRLGSEYLPLRKEFWQDTIETQIEVKKEVKKILMTTGGGDQYNISGKILERILEESNLRWEGIQWHVVSGVYNQHILCLRELASKKEDIVIHENIKSMSELMKECDIAIAASGSTMYELAAVGIPTVCFSFVDNQVQIAEVFGKNSAINVGNYLLKPKLTIEKILIGVEELILCYSKRQKMSGEMRKISDGKGAIRLAKILLENL